MAYPAPVSIVLFSPKRASAISVDIGPLAENSGLYGQLSGLSLRYDLHNSTGLQSVIAKFPSTTAIMPFSNDVIQINVDILLPRNIAAILDHNAGDLLS